MYLFFLQLTNVIVQEVNGTYNATLKEKNILYPINVTVINSSLTQNYTRELRNPVTFQYVNGKVRVKCCVLRWGVPRGTIIGPALKKSGTFQHESESSFIRVIII